MLLHNRKPNKKQIVKCYDGEQLPKIYDSPPLSILLQKLYGNSNSLRISQHLLQKTHYGSIISDFLGIFLSSLAQSN